MATFNNVNEFDVAKFAQHKLVSIRIAAVTADSVDLTNENLGKAMQDFVANFEADGTVYNLKRFKNVECFRKASLLLKKIKEIMLMANHAYASDNSFDMRKAFAGIEEVFKKKVGVINSLSEYIKDNPDERQYYNKSALKARGWTDAMIREFLEKPDIDASPVCGYRVSRSYFLDTKVEEIEKTTAFKARLKQKNQRSKARTAVAAGGVN